MKVLTLLPIFTFLLIFFFKNFKYKIKNEAEKRRNMLDLQDQFLKYCFNNMMKIRSTYLFNLSRIFNI